jgi:hypothetical protein
MRYGSRLAYGVVFGSLMACGGTTPPAAPPPAISSAAPAAPAAAPAPAPAPSPAPAPAPAVESKKAGPTEVDRILEGVAAKLVAKDFAGMQKDIDRARTAAVSDPDERFKVDYQQGTLFTYRGDLEAAAKVFLTYLKETPDQTATPTRFWVHNILMMIRSGQGDLVAALSENDQCTLLGLRGTWPKTDGLTREELTWMKDSWHRAYYSRQLAERLKGTSREAMLLYAEEARKKYTELATPRPDYHRSIGVLDALFATLDGDKDKALAAAKRVEVATNDDVEDLYPAVAALELGGDKATADEVKKRIRSAKPYLAVPIIVKFLDADAGKSKSRFSPRHPTGTP